MNYDANMTSIKSLLKKNILSIKFKKQDGTERTMKCTLLEDMLPVYEKKTERVKKANENVLAVWDLDKEAFRSFKLDSLIEYQVLQEGYEL
jgi:hypothetical protein